MVFIKSNGLTLPKGEKSISTLLIDLKILLIGSINPSLTIVSSKPSSDSATLSRIIFMMSGAEHSCSSLGRLSIHAGRSSMNTWHTHATGLRQSAASRSAVVMSCPRARMAPTMVSATLLGHGGLHNAHAGGAGSPPECCLRAMLSHLSAQSNWFQHVMRCCVMPLIRASSTSVRG